MLHHHPNSTQGTVVFNRGIFEHHILTTPDMTTSGCIICFLHNLTVVTENNSIKRCHWTSASSCQPPHNHWWDTPFIYSPCIQRNFFCQTVSPPPTTQCAPQLQMSTYNSTQSSLPTVIPTSFMRLSNPHYELWSPLNKPPRWQDIGAIILQQ